MLPIDKKRFRIPLHILFWFSYLFIFSLLNTLNYPDVSLPELMIRTGIYSLPIDITATYFTIYFLMPQFLYKRKYFTFLGLFIFSAAFFIILTQISMYYLYVPRYYPDKAFFHPFWDFPYYYYIVATYSIVILAASIKLAKRWIISKDRESELVNQSLKSELSMLKLQISPHFLFNTLNNIDSLILKDSEKASEAVIKLSEIMRYMLYESQQQSVPLEREIQYLQNLIELQQLRLTKSNFIQMSIKGSVDNKRIPALLFVPFIENAIKHCDKNVDSPGIIIDIEIFINGLKFAISNFISTTNYKDPEGGIGLANVKRRLELLFPGMHSLDIRNDGIKFEVDLILEIKQ
ncbi:MAG: sensor histidine kinase [Deltaproteobacteria bacterium]